MQTENNVTGAFQLGGFKDNIDMFWFCFISSGLSIKYI